MAKFQQILPDDVLKEIKKIDENADKIFGGMTKAGADVVQQNVKSAVPLPELGGHVKVSKTYKTPTDGGINTKVYMGGYLPFREGRTSIQIPAKGKHYVNKKGVPAGFISMLYEYGTSDRYTKLKLYRGRITKKPFFRRSFRPSQIEKAMLEAQKKLSGGILDE